MSEESADSNGARSSDALDTQSVVGLAGWERAAAALVGTAMAAFGILAVFFVDSEVSPPVLIATSAVFLLLAIQGTAIRRAQSTSVELDPRASPRQIAREAKEVLSEDGPGDAGAFIEGATRADPELANSPAIVSARATVQSALDYERAVIRKLEQLIQGRAFLLSGSDVAEGYDFAIVPKNLASAPVVGFLKYSFERGVGARNFHRLAEAINRPDSHPALLITNSEVILHAQYGLFSEVAKDRRIIVTTWRSDQDDSELAQVIDGVLQSPAEPDTSQPTAR